MEKSQEYTPGNRVIIRSFYFSDPIKYIEHIENQKNQAKFIEKLSMSRIDPEVTKKLEHVIKKNKLQLVVFSASWCKDCQQVIPVLAKIYQETQIPIKQLGNVKVNLKKPPQWHVPPSPPEINELDVKKIPAILILDQGNIEIARIYEQPPEGKSLEQHLLDTITNALKS
ncbi:MAG: TlpA family protein disulfide reductase [Promethearchaeota archaeon]